MTEDEARNVLETGGVKVQGVDRVYSPLVPEGLAIETKPGAGTLIKPGQGVILKLATQRRPAGYNEVDSKKNTAQTSKGNGTVTTPRNTASNNNQEQTPSASTQTQANSSAQRGVTVSVGGEDDVFIGDDYDLSKQTTTANNNKASTPSASNSNTQQKAATSTANSTTPAAPAQTSQPEQSQASSAGNKTARIRYQVPPIAMPMDLRIEITDPNGTRNVMSRQVRSGESINTAASYSQECIIKIYLGGESVWQERQR